MLVSFVRENKMGIPFKFVSKGSCRYAEVRKTRLTLTQRERERERHRQRERERGGEREKEMKRDRIRCPFDQSFSRKATMDRLVFFLILCTFLQYKQT